MTIENANVNNFEQNNSSDSLNTIVSRHAKHLHEKQERIVEKTRSYPPTYEQYQALELTDRLTAAISMFHGEVPRKQRSSDAPTIPLTFDISPLIKSEVGSIDAQVFYSEGAWSNAVNSTYVSKLPHLSISLRTSLESSHLSDHLADLEVVEHYEENDYKNYAFSHLSFRVAERGFQKDYVSDPEDPLFQDVIKIVDLGVHALYQEKLAARIEKLGSITINSRE